MGTSRTNRFLFPYAQAFSIRGNQEKRKSLLLVPPISWEVRDSQDAAPRDQSRMRKAGGWSWSGKCRLLSTLQQGCFSEPQSLGTVLPQQVENNKNNKSLPS